MDDGNRATPIVYINCVDTLQYSFASHLSMEFRRKGISSFINSKGTLDVIERASASVIVFSDNCLSSTSRLDKLVSVLQCRRKNGLVLVPVFYCISPSDVLVLEHKSSCSADQIRKWSSALQEMRDLPGHQFREECSECEFVEEIVKDVHEKLFPTEQIGINSRLLELEHLLCKQPWGIRRIGIWGMPGIGKTTLAKAFFDQICGGYEASCLIKNFDKAFHEKGLHRLLEEHFGKILKEMPRVCSSITRPSLPRDKLSKKRTLVVLDDLHNPLVFESFLRGIHWFGPGSLIIITSRDKQVFRLCQFNHVYEVQSLNEAEALQLFYQCACVKDMREQNLLKLSMEVVDYASGNPLALRFYGGELKGKKLSEMETTFLKLKLRMPYKIHDLFKSSYETLNDNEKNIFLDIACFFNGENVGYVMRLLEGCGFFPHVGIDVLVEKCLVTISENRVKMHRIIQDFGREIINGETVQIERRRRLWEPWTIKFLLEDDQLKANGDLKATYTRALGTEDIEGISLDTLDLLFDVNPTAFESMLNLRFLKIYCSNYDNHSGLRLPNGLESLPYELRLLHWENYPLQSLPQDFDSCHLVELSMSYSQLQKLWGGTKNIDMLKIFSLCHSQQLTQIDDICKAKNIELIDLQGCTKLQSFPPTGQLQHLRVVNLSGCREIKSFPEVSPNIEELHLQGTGIRELPISIVTLSGQDKLHRELSNLLTEFSDVSNDLNLEKLTSRVQVVSSKQHLSKLVSLNMKDCVHLRSLPHMVDLESLKVLNMSGCSTLDDIQSFPRNLKELYLAGTAIKKLPQLPWSIEILNAHGCVSLRSIPFAFEQLPRYYTFSNCFALSAQVIISFVENALTNVERIAREYQQEQKLNKSLASSFTVPSPASKKITFDMQSGSSVMIQLGSSWRNTLGFAILVEVAFSEDYHEAGGFGISCICRWKDEECVSHRLEKNFNYWTTGEGVPKDHMFVFCDLHMYPGTCEGNDYTILAELVVFEFFIVNKQEESLDKSCTVTKCGVYVITAADRDTSPNVTQSFSSDYLQELSDNEIQDVLRVIHDGLDENEIILFLYIACLFNDKDSDLLAPLIASNGLEISSGLKVLANKSLIHISPYGVIVRHGLLQKIGREIIFRQSTVLQPNVSSEILQRPAYPSSKKVKDWDKLEAKMKKLAYMLSSIPNCAEFFADLVQAYIKLESFTEAVADANKAIELEPSLTKAYLIKGSASEDEEFEQAKARWESLKEMGKKFEDEQVNRDRELAERLNMLESPPRLEENNNISTRAPLDEDEQRIILESLNWKGQITQSKEEEEEDGELLEVNPPLRCLICHACDKPIAIHKVENHVSNSRGTFHKFCYERYCYVCKEKKMKSYNQHPFWEEKYCPTHEADGTLKCCSCERLEPKGTNYVMLGDGRWLCLECMESAVMDSHECQPLHFEIREFFEGLYMKIEKEFPILLVEKQALNKAEAEEKSDHHCEVITRGICLSEEQIVTSVSKPPKVVVNNRLIGKARESQRVVRKCEVTAILILYGLPRLLTGYILAHEMMHAYLRLNGHMNLNLILEEGLCQVLGLMWLETETYATVDATAAAASSSSSSRTHPVAIAPKKGERSDFEKKLVEFCKNQIETDESPVFGDGFRKVNEMVKNSNIHETLKEILRRS